jgi:tetratricopeptide (TPR) repeat protein
MKKDDQNYPPLTENGLSCFIEATGWMELGAYSEVLDSLKTLPQEYQNHFDVLQLRWAAQHKLKNFSECKKIGAALVFHHKNLAESWTYYAQSFYNFKEYHKAYEVLQSVESQFKTNWHFAYDYACYHSLTQDFAGTEYWLKVARKYGGTKKINQMYVQDPDFIPYRQYTQS